MSFPKTVSSLYRPLTEAELTETVSRLLGKGPCAYRPLSGGLFNTTYRVDMADGHTVVLRAGPVNRHLLMPFEHHLMEAESLVYARLAGQNVPTSRILALDTEKAFIDRDIMIVDYIPSVPMSTAVLSPEDTARIARSIGMQTAKMHTLCAPRFGHAADVEHGGGYARWSDCIYGEWQSWLTVAEPTGLFNTGELQSIDRLFRLAAPYLERITVPRLIHTDLWLGNLLIRTDGDRPEFGAIIDADRAIWGDPMYEFSSIRWTYDAPSFWTGYGRPLPQDEYSLLRRAVYVLLNRLLNAYVYAAEYNDPASAECEREDAHRQMQWLNARLGR